MCRIFKSAQSYKRLLFTATTRTGQENSMPRHEGRVLKMFKYSLFVGGLGLLGYNIFTFKETLRRSSVYDVSPLKLALYRGLPLAALTNFAGWFASLNIPRPLREPLYGAYSWMYGCDMNEFQPFQTYDTFNKFFTRPLLEGSRLIDKSADLVSPADGKVIAFGQIDRSHGNDSIDTFLYPEQIKGVKYPLEKLIGERKVQAFKNSKKSIYYCSIYLAPGSYHRFHSPADAFKIKNIDRIEGEVLPVAPWLMRLVPGLVSLNERACISGTWKHGALHMIPVGATNVKSIVLDISKGQSINRSDQVGLFEMGSLVVLIFEGPSSFKWSIEHDQWIKYGQAMGTLPKRFYFF